MPKTKKLVIPPPPHLSERAAALWSELQPAHARSLQRRVLFQAALEALDQHDTARQTLADEGLTFKTESTGAVHEHPALRIQHRARTAFLRIFLELGLCWEDRD